jgi:Flp pilus assembly protein TadD
VSLHPDNVNAARAYGIALLTMGWTQAAEIQLKKAYQMKPEDPETAFNLAVLLATANPPRLPEAAQWYQTAVKNGAQPDPGLDAALKSLGTP